MFIAYYELMFLVSLILTLILVGKWRKRFDVNLALIFVIVDIANMGFVLYYMSQNVEEALIANKITYLGGCFLPLLVLFLVIRMCRFQVEKWIKIGMVALSMIIYGGVLTAGIFPIYYKSVEYRVIDGIVVLDKKYTAFHTCFSAMILIYFLVGVGILAYTYFNKTDVSGKIIQLLLIPFLLSVFGFWLGKQNAYHRDMMPARYNLSLIVYLVIIYKISLYDIIDTGIDALTREGDTGFISLDYRLNYLGSNDIAKKIIPDITRVNIDTCIKDYRLFEDTLIAWIDEFKNKDSNDKKMDQFSYEADGKYYYVNISYLYDGWRKCGYQFFFMDNTEERKYTALIENYNKDLEQEVALKTENIIEMHNRLITSMATMIESRDNSTGGHVRRTSDLVKMLIGHMREDEELSLSDEFCRDVIKAAPMHDLGKIAVEDKVLRKPGKFTPEEFEEMKKHAPEGARIVHEILKGTDDKMFHIIAENVAHFHHERWDGSGYPDKLAGDRIPLEARIMAIADVYDALVSKRVYKEKMSFEKADSIIMEGMGSQFDKSLEKYYVAARPEFEKYYRKIEEEEEAGLQKSADD